jgi:hypothetical protein
MKIDKDRLHPLYDQYSNAENRLTHSLLHTIGSSPFLFSRFLKNIVGISDNLSGGIFEISTQKVPFSHGDDNQEKVESIPDAWIINEQKGIGIAIEVKDVKNNIRISQLTKHAFRIQGYKKQYLLVITPDLKRPVKIDVLNRKKQKKLNVVWCSWDKIYRWLSKLQKSQLSKRKKDEFLLKSMQEYLDRRREVLGFQGIKFDKDFNVNEAKIILNAEMEELEQFVKKTFKDLVRRRPAITTFSQESVWDCFGIEAGFTKDLHLTFGIKETYHEISIIVPNASKNPWKRIKNIFSDPKEEEKLFSTLINLRKQVPHLYIEFIQRHFIAQKIGVRDGFMEFNIDTPGKKFKNKKTKAKEFPIWYPAIKSAVLNKSKINGQIMFKARFYYNDTKDIDKPGFIKTAEKTIKAFKPLYKFLR